MPRRRNGEPAPGHVPPATSNPLFEIDSDSELPRRPSDPDSESGRTGSFRRSALTGSSGLSRMGNGTNVGFSATTMPGQTLPNGAPDDNWLYTEMKGEANNLAEYVKDLLDRRGDDDLQITTARLRRRARDMEKKLAAAEAKLAEALRLAADKDKELNNKDQEVAYWKGKFGPGLEKQEGVRRLELLVDDLKRENKALIDRITSLQEEKGSMAGELEKLRSEMATLSERCDELEEDVEWLEKENEGLVQPTPPPPWWRASRALSLLICFLALAAVGLAIALPLALLLPGRGGGGGGAYSGPQLSENPLLLSVTGRSINVQVITEEDASVYYALVELRGESGRRTGPSPTGSEVAGSSTEYLSVDVSGVVACGRVATKAARGQAISISDRQAQQLSECAGRVRQCRRCPAIDPETRYRLFVSVGYPEEDWEESGVSVPRSLDITTADIFPPRWELPPEVVWATQGAFTLSMALSEEGVVEYAVYYVDAIVDFHGTDMLHAFLDPVCPAQLDLAEADELAGLVAAAGRFDVGADPGNLFEVLLDPPCPTPVPGALAEGYPQPCTIATQGLAPSTEYRLCLLATDTANNRQDAPYCLPLVTGADVTPPRLTATPSNITAISFDVLVAMNERGSVWHLAVEPLLETVPLPTAILPTATPTAVPDTTPLPVSRRMGESRRHLLQLPTPTATQTLANMSDSVPTPTPDSTPTAEVPTTATPMPTMTTPDSTVSSFPTSATSTGTPEADNDSTTFPSGLTVTPDVATTATQEVTNTPTATPTGSSEPPATPTPVTTTAMMTEPTAPQPPPSPLPQPPPEQQPPQMAPPPPPSPSALLCVDSLPVPLPLSAGDVMNATLPEGSGATLVPGGNGLTAVPLVDTEVRIRVSGLRPDTLYRVYLLGQDLADNTMAAPVSLEVATLDTNPPTFVFDYPSVGATSSRNFSLLAAMDEPGRVVYVVVPLGAPGPSSAQVLVGLGADSEAAVSAGSFPAPATCVTATGLVSEGIRPDTAYDVWLVGQDTAGNVMPLPSRVSLVTVDDLPPTLSNLSSTPRCYGLHANVSSDEESTLAYLLAPCIEGLRGQVDSGHVFAGQLPGGLSPVSNGSVSMDEDRPAVLDFRGLANASPYLLFLSAEDAEPTPNRMLAPYRGGVVVETDDCDSPNVSATIAVDEYDDANGNDGPRQLNATLVVSLDESAVVAVQVVDSSSWGWTPSAEDVLASPPCTGPDGAVVFTDSRLVEAEPCDADLECGCDSVPDAVQITVDGLLEERVYSVYVAALDLAGNAPTLTVLELKTPDSAAPSWMWGTPRAVCIDDFSAVLLLQLDELAELNFAVTAADQSLPSMDDLFSLGALASAGSYIASGSLEMPGRPRNATVVDPVVRAVPDPLGLGYANVSDYRLSAPESPGLFLADDCERVREALAYWNNVTYALTPPPAPPSPPFPPPQLSPPLQPPQAPPSPGARKLLQQLNESTPTATPEATATVAPPPPPPAAPFPSTPSFPIQLPTCSSSPPASGGGGNAPVTPSDPTEDVVAYALLITGLRPLRDYAISLGARDKSTPPNAMEEPTVLRFTTTDEKPPEIVFLDVVGFPPSSVSVEIGLNEPGITYFVVQPATAPPPTVDQVFNSSLLNGTMLVATGSAVLSAPFPFTATSGFCGAQCSNEYAIYLVAEDEQVPPNRQTSVRRQTFAFGCGDSTELVIYDNATETCTQTFLAGRARPSLALTPASVGFPSGPAVPMRGYLERSFRVFRDETPGSLVRVVASLDAAGLVPLEADLNTAPAVLSHEAISTGKLARKVHAVPRVGGIWVDSLTLRVAYQVWDIVGRSQVLQQGLSVTALLEGVPTLANQVDCGLPNPNTGVGSCNVALDSAFLPGSGVLDAQIVVQARYTVPSGATLTTRAPPFSLPLHAPPAWAPLSQPAAFISFPVRPIFAGGAFVVAVYAYSPQRCVNEFLLPFFFDPTVLRFEGGSENSALYSPGLLIQDKLAEGIFSLSVQSARSPSTCGIRRGEEVLLATFRFSLIAQPDAVTVLEGVLSCGRADKSSDWVRLMQDGNPTPFNIDNPAGRVAQVNGRLGGRQTQAQVAVALRQMTGILSYLDRSELFDTSAFTGQSVSAEATSVALFSDGSQSLIVASCALSDGGSIVASTMVAADGSSCGFAPVTVPPDELPILPALDVAYQGFQLSLRFVVWFPSEVRVSAEDMTLNRLLAASDVPSDCAPRLAWQRTALSAIATFRAGGISDVSAEVTAIASLQSSNPAAVEVEEAAAYGVGFSAEPVSISVGFATAAAASVTVIPAQVTTSEEVLCVVSLRATVLTGGRLGVPGEPDAALPTEVDVGSGALAVALQGEQVLESEAALGHVRLYATFSDGTTQDVSGEAGVTLRSGDASVLEVVEGSPTDDPTIRVTAEVGRPAVCGEFVFAAWSVCGVELAAGTGPVYVSLPVPTAIALEATAARISCDSDPATLLDLPTSSRLAVQISFDRGGLQDFSSDPRVMFNVTSNADLCEVVRSAGEAAEVRVRPGQETCAGSCTLMASFGGLAAEVTVEVVSLQDVTACLVVWDRSQALTTEEMGALVEERGTSDTCGAPSTLYRLPCAGTADDPLFQQAAIVAVARLTDGELFDVTTRSQTTLVSEDPAVATVEMSAVGRGRNRLYPVAAGTVSVSALFAGAPSSSAAVTVEDNVDYVVEVSLSGDWCVGGGGGAVCSSTFCANTFVGLPSATRQLGVTLTMASGVTYANLERFLSLQPRVMSLESVVSFASDRPEEISLSSLAVATLNGNSACGPVALSANVRPECRDPADLATAVGDEMEVFANLNAPELDVDLGQALGPPLHVVSPCSASVQVGDTLVVPVRVNSIGAPLQALSLLIRYDATLLVVDGCEREVNEKHPFSCNFQLAEGEVRVVVFNEDGVNGAAEFQRAAVLLATLEFRAVATGDVELTGEIIEASQAGQTGLAVTNTEMFAGRIGTCVVDSARRRLNQLPATAMPSTAIGLDFRSAVGEVITGRRHLQQSAALVDCSACTLAIHRSLVGDVNFDCKVDLQNDLLFLWIASSLTGTESREDYYSRLQNDFLCRPGNCVGNQVPSCMFELTPEGGMTEHQKLQLDLFHLQTAPGGATAVEECDNLEASESFRRTGFDGTIIPQCLWRELSESAPGGSVTGVNGVLINSEQVVTSDVKQFFVEVAAKSTVFLGGLQSSELTANSFNLSVVLVNYLPERFATAPLTAADAAQLSVFLDVRNEFPEALVYVSPTTGEPLQTEERSGGQRVRLEFDVDDSVYTAALQPGADRVTFKGDILEVALLVVQTTPAGVWTFVQPWYGSPDYADFRDDAGLPSFGSNFQTTFMPYTYVEIGSGVLPSDCAFPSATAIRDASMALTIRLTGAARVRYVVLPEPLPPGTRPPTLAEVDALQGPAGGIEPLQTGAFDYEEPEGDAVALVVFPTVTFDNDSAAAVPEEQTPSVTSVRSGSIAPAGQRYRLFLTFAKSVSSALVFWPTEDEVLEAPYTFQPGQEAVPLPVQQVPAVDDFTDQIFAYFVVQRYGQPIPTSIQIFNRQAGTGGDPSFSGNFPIQLPSSPTPFILFGNVSMSAMEGSPVFHTIDGLSDRATYSVYMSLDGRGMLQATGVPVVLANVTIPDTRAPTFLNVSYTKDTSRLVDGFFTLELDLETDEAANVTYVVYKQFDCVSEPTLFEALMGAAAQSSCLQPTLARPVAHGSFFVEGGVPTRQSIPDIQLSPVDLSTGYCFEGSLDKVSSLFSVYLLANDVGDTQSCVTQFCASERPDDGIDFPPTADEGCSDPSPRQCGQVEPADCGCLDLPFLPPSDVDAMVVFPQLCRNNLQGGMSVPGEFDASPWQLWVEGQPRGGDGGTLEAVPVAKPAKLEVDLFDDVGLPPSATIIEALIEEYHDHLVIPFRLSAPCRLSFMLTNITLPTEVDVIEGAAGRPSIQGFQVANGRLAVPEDVASSNSLTGEMVIYECPEQGQILPRSPYYLFYVSADKFALRRSELQQLLNLRTARGPPGPAAPPPPPPPPVPPSK